MNTTFTVDQADLANGGSVIGSGGTDTPSTADLRRQQLDRQQCRNTWKASASLATTFTVNQNDLASGGHGLRAARGNDTLVIAGSALDLTSTTLATSRS